MLPNFFVVGAPKAGTTSLYHYLDQHPAIYMSPVKEPAFFAPDLVELKQQLGIAASDDAELRAYLDGPMTQRRSGVVTEWEQYLKLFKNVTHETAVGEVSGNYLGSTRAPASIRERLPHARIVMILRDPVERLFSQHAEAVANGQAREDFVTWVEEQRAREAACQPPMGAVWNGFYARHLARYRACFPAQQLQIFRYEDYVAAPLNVLRTLFSFLDVDPEFPVDMSRRHNVTLQPRFPRLRRASASLRPLLRRVLPARAVQALSSATRRRPRAITPAERAHVLRIYEADIRELRTLDLDVSAWLRG
jgi:hypothetical protein